jgi:hypothetical protein
MQTAMWQGALEGWEELPRVQHVELEGHVADEGGAGVTQLKDGHH